MTRVKLPQVVGKGGGANDEPLDRPELRIKIHEITSLLARRIVGEASKKNLNGIVVTRFNSEADTELLALFPDIEESKREERERIEEMGSWEAFEEYSEPVLVIRKSKWQSLGRR